MSTIFLERIAVLAAVLGNVFVQAVVLSALGWLALWIVRRRSAPTKSAISLFVLVALLILPLVSTLVVRSGSSSPQLNSVVIEKPLSSSETPASPELKTDFSKVQFQLLAVQNGQSLIEPARNKVVNLTESIRFKLVAMCAILVWVVGTIFFAIRLIFGIIVVRSFQRSSKLVDDPIVLGILKNTVAELSVKSQPSLRISAALTAPVSVGFLHPKIILPESLIYTATQGELRCIFLHEISHIVNRDVLTGLIQRIVESLYWWNPFVHRISNVFAIAREDVCDNMSIGSLNNARTYAENLINLAEKVSFANDLPLVVGMATSHIPMADRIKSIISKERNMSTKINPVTSVCCLITVMAISVLVLNIQGFAKDSFSKPSNAVSAKSVDPDVRIENGMIVVNQTDKYPVASIMACNDFSNIKDTGVWANLSKSIGNIYDSGKNRTGFLNIYLADSVKFKTVFKVLDAIGRTKHFKSPVIDYPNESSDTIKLQESWNYKTGLQRESLSKSLENMEKDSLDRVLICIVDSTQLTIMLMGKISPVLMTPQNTQKISTLVLSWEKELTKTTNFVIANNPNMNKADFVIAAEDSIPFAKVLFIKRILKKCGFKNLELSAVRK